MKTHAFGYPVTTAVFAMCGAKVTKANHDEKSPSCKLCARRLAEILAEEARAQSAAGPQVWWAGDRGQPASLLGPFVGFAGGRVYYAEAYCGRLRVQNVDNRFARVVSSAGEVTFQGKLWDADIRDAWIDEAVTAANKGKKP